MELKSSLLSLVFTDLVDSTALKTQLGDQKAAELIECHQERLRALRVETGGREVDTAGDGFFLTFETPSAAVTFALRLQQIHHAEPELPKVRVGIHLGEVSERPAPEGAANALFIEGLAVDLAGRIQSLAQPGQVLVSSPVLEAAQQRLKGQEIEPQVRWRTYGRYRLKGIRQLVEIGEAGFDDISPLKAPPDSEKARRVRYIRLRGIAAAAVALVLLGLSAWWTLRPVELGPINSIAVLPLEDYSGDSEQAFFAEGMTEALISELARLGALGVVSRTSVMQYRGTRRALPDIAAELGVGAILEGSVLRDAGSVRITVQLIDAHSDRHLWSKSYERPEREILKLQSEVASAIAREIQMELAPDSSTRTREAVNPEAYESYLKGTHFLDGLSAAEHASAVKYFERAVEQDPNYAPGWALLAFAYT